MRVLEEYLARLEQGAPPSPEELVHQHPELADRLQEFLASLEFLHRAALNLHSGDQADGAVPAIPELGELGDFRIAREIGRGGMGVVYEAEQISLGRRVALKVLPFAGALDPKQLQRFKNEAQSAAHLHHQNIVPVHAVGCERGVHYYAMQYIEGQTVAALIRELRQLRGLDAADKPQSAQPAGIQQPEVTTQAVAMLSTERSFKSREFVRAVANLGVQAAEALEHAHELGVIHRDIKPANLIVEWRAGSVNLPNLWITDFGLAQCQGQTELTLSGDFVGTLRYMSPEQATGKRGLLDYHTDIYSLGVTLYELLTLEPACNGRDRQEMLRHIEWEEPCPPRSLNPAIPMDLETIILKAIAKVPSERYATAKALADDLRRFLEDKPILAKRPTLVQRMRKWSRRHQAVAATIAVATVLLLGLAVLGLAFNNWQVRREQERTRAENGRVQASYRMARQAMEDMAKSLAEDERLASGPLEPLRRKALEIEASFYQNFVELRGDEPAFRAERGRAYRQLASVNSRFGRDSEANEAYRQAVDAFTQLAAEQPIIASHRQDLALCQLNWSAHLRDREPARSEEHAGAARALYADLAAEYPKEPAYRLGLARCFNNLGNVYLATNRPGAAEQAFLDALALGDALVRQAPENPAYLADLAKHHSGLGILYASTGRLAAAEPSFEQARALHKQLAAIMVPGHQLELAGSNVQLGRVYQFAGRLKEAEDAFLDAVKLRKEIAGKHPMVVQYQSDLADSYGNLGYLYMNSNRRQEAARQYEDAAATYQRLIEEDPKVTAHAVQLGGIQNNLGTLARDKGGPAVALAWHERALVTLEKALSREPAHMHAKDYLCRTYQAMGETLADLRRGDDAEQAYLKGLALRKALVDEYPRIVDYQLALGYTHNELGRLYQQSGRFPKAEQAYREALTIQQSLTAGHSDIPDKAGVPNPYHTDSTRYAVALGGTQCNLGNLMQDTGRLKAAVAFYDQAIATLGKVLARQPGHATARQFAVNSRTNCAEACNRLGRHREALETLSQAATLDDGRLRTLIRLHRAVALAGVKDHGRALTEIDEIAGAKDASPGVLYNAACACTQSMAATRDDSKQAEQYAVRAVQLLRRAIARGYNDLAHLKKDPDLDPLRQREDFQKLLMELGDRHSLPN
jgi:serine/threonine protein kinase